MKKGEKNSERGKTVRKSGRHDGRVAEVRRVRYACEMRGSIEIFCDLGEAGYEELGLFFFFFLFHS